jgi:nucleotide-binding universal stress UspA family protein
MAILLLFAIAPFVRNAGIVVPIANPQTERYLMEMAMLLARSEKGRIVPLAIAQSQGQMDDPQMEKNIRRTQKLLTTAKEWCQEWQIKTTPRMRIEFDVAQAIAHASREESASLILLGMSQRVGFRAFLFGSITDNILHSAHCLVVVARLLESPLVMRRLLVPVANLTPAAMRAIRVALIIAEANQAEVTLLHVYGSATSRGRVAWIQNQLSLMINNLSPSVVVKVEVSLHGNVTEAIVKSARSHDLVVLRSQRRRVGGYGLTMGRQTTSLLQQLPGSVVLLGEPQGTSSRILQANPSTKSFRI